ncbi:hypothetical protein ACYX8G_06130 [Microbacterium saperdae]
MSAVASSPVRTAEKPWAFTGHELIRGGITAWFVFMMLLICGETAHLAMLYPSSALESAPERLLGLLFFLMMIALVAGVVSAFVVPFGIVIMLPIALALRRVRSVGVHLAVYALLGAAIGGGYLVAFRGGRPLDPVMPWDYFVVVPAASAALAIPLAWWWTARRALRIDAGLITPGPRHPDLDAAYEDRVTAGDHAEAPRDS